MIPFNFSGSNIVFSTPEGMTKEQVEPIKGFFGTAGGSCFGMPICVVAYKPDPEELQRIIAGEPIFLTCIGGVPPHYLSTSFEDAVNPA